MEKQSKIQWGAVAASIIGSGTIMIGSVFADEMLAWFKENKMKSKSKEYYREMLKAHPALKKEDPKVVARYWASLFHFAPHMAADPLSAGAFIRQSIDRGFPELYGGPPVDTYNTLAAIQKAQTEAKQEKRRFSEIADAAVGKVVGTGLVYESGYGSKSDFTKLDTYGPLEAD